MGFCFSAIFMSSQQTNPKGFVQSFPIILSIFIILCLSVVFFNVAMLLCSLMICDSVLFDLKDPSF